MSLMLGVDVTVYISGSRGGKLDTEPLPLPRQASKAGRDMMPTAHNQPLYDRPLMPLTRHHTKQSRAKPSQAIYLPASSK
jgi:hypothetical protein